MKKYIIFLLFIVPAISQDLIINSFDNSSDFDEDYWILDLTGDSEIGYANYNEASISHDNQGALEIEYSVHNSEIWGGFTKLSHFHPDPNSVYDFTGFNTISFWYYNTVPANQSDRMDIRFVLFDISTSPDNNVYSESQVEYFYSFHFDMLDMVPGWNKVEIPLTGTSIPDQSLPYTFGFNNTGWNGLPGDGSLDLDSIKGFAIEFFVNNPTGSSGDSVGGNIIIDELKVENTNIEDPEEVTVTFQVDMSNENINPSCPPSIGGGWNGWQWTYTLEEDQNNIWSTQITVNSGVEYEYKFGNCGWSLEELEVGSSCTNTTGTYTNRILSPISQDTILPPVCFGSCDSECPTPEYVDVTFQVDTNNNAEGFDSMCDMYLIGSFQEPFPWDIDIFPVALEDQGNGIWGTTVSILSGTYIEYKFANCEGSDSFIENDINICSVNGNRSLTIPYDNITLPTTYFNSCNSEGTSTVTFQVDMSNQSVGGGDGLCGVHIGGTFNYFDWWATELSDDNGDNIWDVSAILNIGDEIEYKFANCGSFEIESVPSDCAYGEDLNRIITVPSENLIIDPICFGSCNSECGELSYSDVTFIVDMSETETSSSGVFVSGPNLQGPSGAPLSDEDGDDVWSATIQLAYGEYTYKFRNGYYDDWDSDGWEEPENLEDCGIGEYNDRIVTVNQPTINLNTVCFESCEACSASMYGDANADGNVDVLDIVVIVNGIINSTQLPDNCDVNNDNSTDILDIVTIVQWIIGL